MKDQSPCRDRSYFFLLSALKGNNPLSAAKTIHLLLTVLLVTTIHAGFAQTAGDYRSNTAALSWNNPAHWQKFNGASWGATADYPGQNACGSCTVTIQNGHTATLNVSPANSIGSLVVGGGSTGSLSLSSNALNVTGTLRVNAGATLALSMGTFTVGGTSTLSGTVSDTSNVGVNTFTGLVTKTAGTWTSTAVTTAANMIFSSGITNTSGTFNAGAATIGDNKTLTGTVNMSFASGLVISGNKDVTIAGTTTNGVTIGGTANCDIRNLTLTGLLTVSTTGNFTVTGTTSMTGSGAFTDNDNNGITSFTGLVTHNSTGAWTSTAVTTAANMVFLSGFTNTAGTFTAGAATIGDNQTLTGTVNMSFASGLVILGNKDVTVAGTTATGVTVAGAASLTVRNLSLTGLLYLNNTGNFTVTGTTSVTGSGAFTDNDNTGVTTFTGLITHNSTGTWRSTAVTTVANMIFASGFNNVSGACSIGAATIGDNQTLTGTANSIVFNNGFMVLGNGDLNVSGTTGIGVYMSGAANYTVRNLSLMGALYASGTGNFTVTGTTSMTGAGAFSDTSNNGVTSFAGLITHNSTGSFSTTAVTNPANLIISSGIMNISGACNLGGATIGDNQTLTSLTNNISISNGLVVQGNGDLNIAGTATLGVNMAGSASYSVRNLNLTGRLSVTTSGNLTVSGTVSITGTGSFVDNNNTGVTTFNGTVTHNSTGVWSTTTVATPANMVFNAGVNNVAGSFSAGAATIAGGQTLNGTIVMSFNRGLVVSGTGNLTVSGAGGVILTGTAIHYTIPGNLTLTGTLQVRTSGNFTVAGTTTITGAGDFTDNNNAGISTFTGLVTHNSTGRWVSTSVTTPANMIFMQGFTNTAGSFSAGGATIADNKTLTGTVNMSFNRGVVVQGNGDITIAGTATSGVTFATSGATPINYSVRNITISGMLTVSTSGNLTVTGTTNITGAFLDNNGTGITSFAGLVTLGSSATFTANSVTTLGRLTFAGGITNNNTAASSFAAGTIRTTATQAWSGSGNIVTTGAVDINTGTLTNNITGSVTVGGTLSGTTWVQGTNAYLYLGSTTPLTITTLTATASGNTVNYKSAGSATIRSQTYHHLIISGSGTKMISTTDITVNGNLTISAGALGNTTNNRNITLYGNWINNVATNGFVPGTGTVTFAGSTVQTLGGTGNTTFYKLTVNNAAGITQTSNSTITNVLTFTAGNITTGTSVVIISSTGSVARTSGHINGNEQRNFATGSNVSRTFDIGDASGYTPVTVVFASVSTAGNITMKTTGTEHPALVTATINGSLSVNRYWTITNSGTVFTNYSATLNFLAGDKDASLNTSNVIAGRYTASWSYPTVGTKTSTSTQVTGLTAFGDLAVGEPLLCTTPSVVITDPAPFCSPATVDLTAPAVTAGSTGGLTFTYWTDSLATVSLSSPSAVGTGGTYYIKGTVPAGGCSDVSPVVVTRINPTGIISGTATVCTGSSALLSIAVTGSGPWSGTLSNGASFSGSSSPITVSVTPVSNTTYTISTLSDAGCTAQTVDKTGSAVITLAALPTASNAGPDQGLCLTSTTLAANTPVVGTGTWSVISGTGGSFSSVTDPATTFTGTTGVVYTLRWEIDNAPCPVSTDDVIVGLTSGSWTGIANTDWNNAANWCGGAVPSGIIDLVLTAGLPYYPAIEDDIVVNNLTILTGASIAVTNNGKLAIKGDYSNNGTIDNNGTVILNGTAQQRFPGASAAITAMKNLEVDNDAGVVIDKSFDITGELIPTSGTIDLSDKNITLVSSSAGTARVSNVGGSFDYSGGGKFILERYVPARRAWRLYTVPLTNTNNIFDGWQNGGVYTPGRGTFITGPGGANGLDADGNSSFKQWDMSSQTLVPVLNTNAPVSPGVSGAADNKGYFLFVRGDRNPVNLAPPNTNVTVLSCAGELQTGDQTFSASSVGGNFTLLGNPYASPIDFNTLARTNLVKRFYVWDPSLNSVGGYVTMDDVDDDGVFSNSVLGSEQTNELLSHQAFFVETAANGTAGITIKEDDKTDGSTYIISRPVSSNRQTLNISLYLLGADGSTALADGTRAEFSDDYDNAVTPEDARKFVNINETFSLLRNNVPLALERKPLAPADTLFIKFNRGSIRSYQMRFKPNGMSALAAQAFVKDNFTGVETPVSLSDTTVFNFDLTADPASYVANRFMIVFKPYSTLPVVFTHLAAAQKTGGIMVSWKVAAAQEVIRYEVEKSPDGSNFTVMHTVPAANAAIAPYSWLDANPITGKNFYRIRSVSSNGTVKWSEIVMVTSGKNEASINVYPNPVKNNTIGLQFTGRKSGSYNIRLFTANGVMLYTTDFTVTDGNGTYHFKVPAQMLKGNYFIEVTGNDTRFHQQVVVE